MEDYSYFDSNEDEDQRGDVDGGSMEQELVPLQQEYPQARHHTYLHGGINPVYNISSNNSNNMIYDFANTSDSSSCYDGNEVPNWVQELAVFELFENDDNNSATSGGIVIFPGSIIPLRLFHSEWINYIHEQIARRDASVSSSSLSDDATEVRFGILMPRCNMDRNSSVDTRLQYTELLDDFALYQQQRHDDEIQEQHRSINWTRQGHGPNALRRLSQQLIEQLGPNFHLEDDYDDSSSNDDEDDDEETFHTALLDRTMVPEPETRVTTLQAEVVSPPQSQAEQRSAEDGPIHHRQQTNNDIFSRSATNHSSNPSSNVTFRSLQRLQGEYVTSPFASRHHPQQQRHNRRTENSLLSKIIDPYIGRIGTIATVLYTHGNAEVQNSNNNADSTNSLVITAIGTTRFQIVGYRSKVEEEEYSNRNHISSSSYLRRRQLCALKHFLIEEICDKSISIPSHVRSLSYVKNNNIVTNVGTDDNVCRDNSYSNTQQYASYISTVMPYPKFIIQNKMSSWKIMSDICTYIKHYAVELHGLLSSKSKEAGIDVNSSRSIKKLKRDSCSTNSIDNVVGDSNDVPIRPVPSWSTMEPTAFSYWMATNLPLRYYEKMYMLEMISTTERLQYIRHVIQNEQIYATKIHCRYCNTRFATVSDMFTVHGADGTTGNYVNEHGIIHQTVTLRVVDLEQVWFQGGAHVQDSWFPGYSWTIMCCTDCGHHLGWKFQTVVSTTDIQAAPNEQRPSTFFGVSATNINTYHVSNRPK